MAIKYVRATGGSDSNNGLSFDTAWATIAYAFNAANANRVAPGDTLAVCGDSSSNIFVLTASVSPTYASTPTWANPVYIAGYDMMGNPRTGETYTKITTNSSISALILMNDTVNDVYTKFSNILFDGGGSGKATCCVATSNSDDFEGHVFDTCRFTNASLHGISVRMATGLGSAWRFFRCEIDNNGKGGTGHGIYCGISGRGSFYIKGCKIRNNSGAGVVYGENVIVLSSLIYRNGMAGVHNTTAGSSSISSIFEQNVFYANSGDGLYLTNSAFQFSIVNNIFKSNGGYGINTNGMDIDRLTTALVTNNCSYNNTSGHIDINSGILPGSGNITSDPQFISEVLGNENFTLQSTSPCINAGYNPLGY